MQKFGRLKGATKVTAADKIYKRVKGASTFKSPVPKDIDSTVALQSGDAANPTPYWDIGVDDTGQFVQIVDTSFDDASCFLRDDPKEGLTGNLSDTLQVGNVL